MPHISDKNLPDAIHNEGLLFVPAVLDNLLHGDLDKELPLRLLEGEDFIAARNYSFDIARRLYLKFQTRKEQRNTNVVTRDFVFALLNNALGWHFTSDASLDNDCPFLSPPLDCSDPKECKNAAPIAFPVILAPHTLSLDSADSRFHHWGLSAAGRSATRFAQEFLNNQRDFRWGMVTNGYELRLLRNNLSLTRPCFLSFKLDDILSGDGNFPAFAVLWRCLHGSCVNVTGNPAVAPWDSANSLWEKMRERSAEDGIRALDGLREGVVNAIERMGTGFIKANASLREKLNSGEITLDDFEGELLRLAYRFLFLFVAEERGLLHTPAASPAIRKLYRQGYSMERLRRLAARYAAGADRHYDLYQGVGLVFKALAQGEPRLGLAALGGIFDESACPHLDNARLQNADLLAAMRALRFIEADRRLLPVNYRDMGPEELGSVYESLLEYVPRYSATAQTFTLAGAAGNSRKTTASYYTPDPLVHELIESALSPLIAERLRSPEPEKALLSLTVIDPACGSGHFLLAAARKIAAALVIARNAETSPEAYQTALRDSVSHCLYGVDLNPLAVELTKITLWIESLEPGKPLSFLDAHIVCGDSTLGLDHPDILKDGIPDKAYDCLTGDNKITASALKKRNRDFLKFFRKGSFTITTRDGQENSAQLFSKIEEMPDASLDDVRSKRAAYQNAQREIDSSVAANAANLFMAAFLMKKTPATMPIVPTSEHLFSLTVRLNTFIKPTEQMLAAATNICKDARVLHWHLAFPAIFKNGGFDCILANPPWDRVKLQEKEFFAARDPDIANAPNANERKKLIARLALPREQGGNPYLLAAFEAARRRAEVASVFLHDGGRFVLANVGDINLYSIFTEVVMRLRHSKGRAGIVVPTGICTDDSNKGIFQNMVRTRVLHSLYDFENAASGKKIFEAVHPQYRFSLLTLGQTKKTSSAFFLGKTEDIYDERRRFELTADDYARFNPNTMTSPIPRARHDIELLEKIYRRVPVLWNERQPDGNPWGIKFRTLFHMSNDSSLFEFEPREGTIPLYEAKLIHQFDHRWATFIENRGDKFRDLTDAEKANLDLEVRPRYWVDQKHVDAKLEPNPPKYLMGWRDITNATNSRTVIAAVIPPWAVGDKFLLFQSSCSVNLQACLLADMNALVHDWCARLKIAGTDLKFHHKRQIPTLPPSAYTQSDLDYIVPRVLELTYTSHSLKGWAEALGYDGEPFTFEPERRAQLRAELDAWYARLYGLTEEELTYILDPAAVFGDDYPSESFRVLKDDELRTYGEFRTARLVLEAFRKLP